MKIAVISDIHGNLPALEAVLMDIDRNAFDIIFCLGDLVNFAPWPNEVIELMHSRNITAIMGNHDEGIGLGKPDFPFSYQSQEEQNVGLKAIAYTNIILKEDNRNYLRSLPKSIDLKFKLTSGSINALFAHGSPRNVNEYIFESHPESDLLEMMDEYRADILITGHTHRPFHRLLFTEENNERLYKHVVNAGSVGRPKDGDNRAAYLSLEINEDSSLFDPSTIGIQIHRVDYDIERVQQAIYDSDLPDLYAQLLTKA